MYDSGAAADVVVSFFIYRYNNNKKVYLIWFHYNFFIFFISFTIHMKDTPKSRTYIDIQQAKQRKKKRLTYGLIKLHFDYTFLYLCITKRFSSFCCFHPLGFLGILLLLSFFSPFFYSFNIYYYLLVIIIFFSLY